MKINGKLLKGIRGAIQVNKNEKKEILQKTIELLEKMIQENNVRDEDIVSVFFTVTKDINMEFPAYALREMGLKHVPALCAKEIDVPKSMKRVIRILIHVYTNLSQKEIKHQYLGDTKILRPDLSRGKNDNSN